MPKVRVRSYLLDFGLFGPFWAPLGQNSGHPPHRHTPNCAKTSARMSSTHSMPFQPFGTTRVLKVRFWPFLDHFGPFWGLLDKNWGEPRTPNWVKTSTRTSSNLFHTVPTVLGHQSAPARALKPTSIIGHKRAILGNRGQKTARRAAERAPTGKPKVSRVTSGYEKDMNPLSQVSLRPKKGVIWA